VTAEFAVALPAVLACIALCVGAASGAAQLAGLTAGAAAAARLAGRGDDPGSAPVPDGAGMTVERDGSTVCVRLIAADGGALSRIGVRLSARACALDEGAEP
jgi:hypothetical protein